MIAQVLPLFAVFLAVFTDGTVASQFQFFWTEIYGLFDVSEGRRKRSTREESTVLSIRGAGHFESKLRGNLVSRSKRLLWNKES